MDASTSTNERSQRPRWPRSVGEQEIYSYYTENLLPALLSSLPVLLLRLYRDGSTLLSHCLEHVVRFLFPEWLLDKTDSIVFESGEMLNQLRLSMQSSNSTSFVNQMMERIEGSNTEEMRRDFEAMMLQYYVVMSETVNKQQSSSWYAWMRETVTSIMTVDWSLGAYLWRTSSGLILVLIITSIIPGRLHGWTGRLLRLPILCMTYLLIGVELVMYTTVRLSIRALESFFGSRKHRALRAKMENAKSYEEWYLIAKQLDASQGRRAWQSTVDDDTAYRYSWPFILELKDDLQASRQRKDITMALAVLQQCTRKNVGGLMQEEMFSFLNTGEPKQLVVDFITEVETTLFWLTDEVRKKARPPPDDMPPEEFRDSVASLKQQLDFELETKVHNERNKLFGQMLSWATLGILGGDDAEHADGKRNNEKEKQEDIHNDRNEDARKEFEQYLILVEKVKTFLKRARAAYGRTALCLSGGAMLANYHFGAIRALIECDLLPHIMSGTSGGACIAAMVCTRTNEELATEMTPENIWPKMSIFQAPWSERIKRFYQEGTMFDQQDWLKRAAYFGNGDMTFAEAYKKTGRVLCVTLSATCKKAPPVLINYITAPNVTITSAIVSSAAVPGFIDAMRLQVKDENGKIRDQGKQAEEYRDGSIDSDIPVNGLAEMLNCRFFLAAQANPHIVPFFYNSKGDVGRPSRWSSGMRDDSWRGGFLLAALEMYLKNDMRSKFHFLNDLEVALGFTSTMMTQTYSGTTTIVPQVCLRDFIQLFGDQTLEDMNRYFQGGSVAAYQHVQMMRLHYRLAHALDECLALLELDETPKQSVMPPRRRRSQLMLKQRSQKVVSTTPGGSLHFTVLDTEITPSSTATEDDEMENGGFDGPLLQ